MQQPNDTLSGFVRTIALVRHGKDKSPYKEKSKDKERRKDYSNERNKKRNWE